jgi:CheY-like chemotaxis protein
MMHADQRRRGLVLVVEDEPDFAALMSAFLERHGYATILAANGEEAMVLIRENPPDLVTLDIQMPRCSGLLFYRQMKSDPSLRRTPVVVVTGLTRGDRAMENFIRSFLEVGG